jgi:hypothetical protein
LCVKGGPAVPHQKDGRYALNRHAVRSPCRRSCAPSLEFPAPGRTIGQGFLLSEQSVNGQGGANRRGCREARNQDENHHQNEVRAPAGALRDDGRLSPSRLQPRSRTAMHV